ncbi:type-1 angiotensin II receptor-associated protein-like [Dendronephthya gigantea]|uniref:type-1 angiotensin II receptor-associated protein-like n=1 Tax=Dendronephthya gigantea TaxID=151771 RepID=UPI00106B570A|nr:type-1 angiotensin II receptor-associated protein-like [Dendronephthya gigantea]
MALPKVSVVFLQVIIVIHFILTVWANQCAWLPVSYQFCNFLVLALGVGAVVASSDHAISELFLVGMAFALLHDIIIIAVTYDGDEKTAYSCTPNKDRFRFSFAMSILNLLLKPVSILIILLNYLTRGDGGLRQKVAQYRANKGSGSQPPNDPLPPQNEQPAPPPYGGQPY